MEWSFETGGGGVVTVRQEGDRAMCQALRNAVGEGLYKARLQGGRGSFLLGTLIPEGGALRLRRNVSVAQLQREGVWPPTGADIVMAFPFTGETAPSGFSWEEQPWKLTPDRLISPCLQRIGRCLIRKYPQGFSLVIPFRLEEPFPLPPLFCLSRTVRLDGKTYLQFSFSREGRPVLPYDFLNPGETVPGPDIEGKEWFPNGKS